MAPGRVTVVVVTWNAADVVADCLASVPHDVHMVVVDNASSDGTPDVVRARFPGAELVTHDRNLGFAAGVNAGLARAATEYVLLLNPDARLEPGAVEALVAFCDERPRAGLASALVLDPAGRVEPFTGGREPSLVTVGVHQLGLARPLARWSMYSRPVHDQAERRDWVGGTCALVRRAAVDDVGPLDESYFLYAEDIEWCARMRAGGWEVWVVPTARVRHARSTIVDRAGPWVDEHRLGSLDRYYAERHGRPSVVAFRLVRLAGIGARALAFDVAGGVSRRSDLRDRGRRRGRDACLAWRLLLGQPVQP